MELDTRALLEAWTTSTPRVERYAESLDQREHRIEARMLRRLAAERDALRAENALLHEALRACEAERDAAISSASEWTSLAVGAGKALEREALAALDRAEADARKAEGRT